MMFASEMPLSDLKPWSPGVAGVRDAVQHDRVAGAHFSGMPIPPEVAYRILPREHEVERIADMARDAVRAGRLIDFGLWSNDVIKFGGKRGGPLYARRALTQPFRDTWILMHRWDQNETAVYLVYPLEPDAPAGDFEAVELQPVTTPIGTTLMIGDRIYLEGRDNQYDKYHCAAIPSVWRYFPYSDNGMSVDGSAGTPEGAAAGNVLDPIMTGLLILSTRGVERETVTCPPKLARARAKSRKPPIPPYDRVNSSPYITAITARLAGQKGTRESKGGTHASPIPHLRMGHPRTYANGRVSMVRDALVNMSEEAKAGFRSQRTHYEVRQ